MLLLAYALFGIVALAATSVRGSRFRIARRVVPFTAAVGLAVLGMKLPPSLFALALIAGGGCFALGLLDADTPTAHGMRRFGFVLCVAALAIPSTATLALPIVGLLLIDPVVRSHRGDTDAPAPLARTDRASDRARLHAALHRRR